MKKLVLAVTLFLLTVSAVVFAQGNKPVANEEPIFKPNFIVGDVYVVFTIFETIDIKGNEVEAFLEVKNTVNSYLQEAQNKNLKATDKIVVNMPTHLAQNCITFLSRATLKGNMAESYKRFIDAVIEASKAVGK